MKIMGIIKKPLLMALANGAGLYLATKFVPDVTVPLDLKNFALAVGALTLINLLLRPIVRLMFMPVIILTLGLGGLVVNALMLYFLDFLMPAVTIEGLVALAIATLILAVSNLAIRILGKIL